MYNSREVADRIKQTAKNMGITIKQMLIDCDLNKDSISTMQSKGFLPRTESLAKIADYLNCSVDYLLGRTDDPTNYDDPDLIANLSNDTLNHFNGDVKKAVNFQNAVDADAQKEHLIDNESKIMPITDRQLKFALFGNSEIDDELLDDVKHLAKLQMQLRDEKKR